MNDLYQYYYRPAYGSSELLIEVFAGAESSSFVEDLLNTISVMDANVQEIANLWMNDEVMFTVRTKFGDFELSKDIWGTGFLMSRNQECLQRVNSLLEKDARFRKVDVDFGKYK